MAHWPQFAFLADYRDAFDVLSLLLLLLVPLMTMRNRGHIVNAWFLRRYLKQQIDHLGYRPARPASPFRKNPTGTEVVTVTGAGRFNIVGFEWSFDLDLVKNTVVLGQVGFGKTVAVLNSLLFGLIAAHPEPEARIAGLVPAADRERVSRVVNKLIKLEYQR